MAGVGFFDTLKAAFATKARASDLLAEQAKPAVGSALSPHRDSEVESLTPARLGALLRDADRGRLDAYLTLAAEMEEREPHYRSVLGTRKLGVSGLPVVVEAPDDSTHFSAITDDVEQNLLNRPNFEGLVLDLMDGVAKGFSCVEILWQRDAQRWEPSGYEYREQRHFIFDSDTLSVPRLRSLTSPVEGEPLLPYKWLVHKPKIASGVPVRTGLARTVAVCYAAKKYTITDWLIFLDVFGMPARIGKYPKSMAGQRKELLKAVRSIGVDAAAVIPSEMTIEILERKGGSGSSTAFLESAEYWDKQTSKVVLGQTMTTDDGSSLAQAKVHQEVRVDIRAADARAVAATINRDLIRPFIDLNYGPQKAYPTVRFVADEPEDSKSFMESVRVFVNLGGKVQMSEVRDRLGLSEPQDDSELLVPEAAAAAAAQASPAAAGDAPGGERTKPTGGAPGKSASADEDDEIEGDAGKQAELNRSRFAEETRTKDTVDDLADDALEEWRPLVDENVGRLLERIQAATSYEEARELLDELARDAGDQLALDALTSLLARKTFQSRGIGDATDDTEV